MAHLGYVMAHLGDVMAHLRDLMTRICTVDDMVAHKEMC